MDLLQGFGAGQAHWISLSQLEMSNVDVVDFQRRPGVLLLCMYVCGPWREKQPVQPLLQATLSPDVWTTSMIWLTSVLPLQSTHQMTLLLMQLVIIARKHAAVHWHNQLLT